jgi:plastocyanin
LHAEYVVTAHGDSAGYYFSPPILHIHTGDRVTWQLVSGGPHNIAFDSASVGALRETFAQNMPMRIAELSSALFMNLGESYSMTFDDVPPGTYLYHCTPHLALGQKGAVVVDPE